MTIADEPWEHPDPLRSGLRLVSIPTPVLHALARGEVAPESPVPITPYLLDDACRGLWRMRSEQLVASPGDAAWVTRFVVVGGEVAPVGLAGFHGMPDAGGTVEIGYRIDPGQRRKGYARHALETLLAVAAAQPGVRTLRATIRPDNDASLALVRGYGFTDVGEQWDVQDGVELVLERPAGP